MFNISASLCMSHSLHPHWICVEQSWFASFPLAATEKLPLVTLELLGQTHKPQFFPPRLVFGLGTVVSVSRL